MQRSLRFQESSTLRFARPCIVAIHMAVLFAGGVCADAPDANKSLRVHGSIAVTGVNVAPASVRLSCLTFGSFGHTLDCASLLAACAACVVIAGIPVLSVRLIPLMICDTRSAEPCASGPLPLGK